MKLILFACLLGAAFAASSNCKKIMKRGGVSEDFAKHVSHAIHSLTVEDIRTYFNENAVEDNKIPVVNPKLRDYPRVLENAPIMGYDEEFVTDGMKYFDVIMRGINMEGWSLGSFDLIERLSHVFHMTEIWAFTGKKYKKVIRRLKTDSELCDCVRDLDTNGLRKYLELTAFQIRYPGITSGNSTVTDTYLGGTLDYHISYGLEARPWNIGKQLADFDFSGTDEELIEGVIKNLVDSAKFNLWSKETREKEADWGAREHWEDCVQDLKELLTDELIYDTAVFMRCQLNIAHEM